MATVPISEVNLLLYKKKDDNSLPINLKSKSGTEHTAEDQEA
jgi:hypothetical protein